MLLTFEVGPDDTMRGTMAWPGLLADGEQVVPAAIEGKVFLITEHSAAIRGDSYVDCLHLEGVVGRASHFAVDIPLHRDFGKVYQGSDAMGHQYALRLVEASGERLGF